MDVFISYAREDYERAHTVASALQARGWSVWWDREVTAGQAFDQVIERELETAKSVIVLWSKYSIASEWVKNEAAAAMQRGVFVPALIDPVKVPLEFSRRHTADLTNWDGDISHAGFQALCDGVTATAEIPPVLTSPDTSKNRQATGSSWHQRLVLKGWWQTLPGILLASAVFLAALSAVLNQAWSRREELAARPQGSQGTHTPANAKEQGGKSTSIATAVAPSTDRDNPTRLISNEIRGRGVGERISYYFTCNGGPGVITVTVDGKSKNPVGSAVYVELSDMDAKPLLGIDVDFAPDEKRVIKRIELFRQQQVIVRVVLFHETINYMVRLEGAVDFTSPSK